MDLEVLVIDFFGFNIRLFSGICVWIIIFVCLELIVFCIFICIVYVFVDVNV